MCKIHEESSKTEILTVVCPDFYPRHSRKSKVSVFFKNEHSKALDLGTAPTEGWGLGGRQSVIYSTEKKADAVSFRFAQGLATLLAGLGCS